MLKAIEAYLDLRRATGFAMSNAEYLLKSFAAFAAERGQTLLRQGDLEAARTLLAGALVILNFDREALFAWIERGSASHGP